MKLPFEPIRPFVAGLLALCLTSPSALIAESATCVEACHPERSGEAAKVCHPERSRAAAESKDPYRLHDPEVLLAQATTPAASPATDKLVDELAPLPQDDGRPGLELLLKRLRTTARLLHTTAHP